MGKKKLKIVLELLDNVSINYPERTQYFENNILELWSREKLSAEEVFYFVVLVY